MDLYVSVFKAMFFLAISLQTRDFISRSPVTSQTLEKTC